MNPLTRLGTPTLAERELGGFVHTPAEIAQQPASWQITYGIFKEMRGELQQFLEGTRRDRTSVYLVGAGTSDYIGHAVAHLLRRHWRCEVTAVASTDLVMNRDDLVIADREYLWISFSRSGESPEGVAVLEQALAMCPKVKHLVVSCNRRGKMVTVAREHPACFVVVLDDAVNDRGLAMTSSFTNMVIFGQALALLWDEDGFQGTLDCMTSAAEFVLDKGSWLAYDLAREGYQRACFIGSGSLGAAARESALKLSELTAGGIQGMCETTLGLRHGPMSSLNQETLLVSFLSSDGRRRRYESDLLREVSTKQIVRTIVVLGGDDPASQYQLTCEAFAGIDDAYRPVVDVIFSQMLGLFSSLELGLRPDSPSPLGLIHRVVEKFAIYA